MAPARPRDDPPRRGDMLVSAAAATRTSTCSGRCACPPEAGRANLVTWSARGRWSSTCASSPRTTPARFRNFVFDGKGTAMPAFRGRIGDEDVELLWAYVRGGLSF